MSQQIYAQIKRTSKYYGQTEPRALFAVHIAPQGHWEYIVRGGPGGGYRLSDVNLYVVEDGHEIRISK